jgi:prophage DNA circulation protein
MRCTSAAALLAISALALGAVACSSGDGRSAGRYCTTVGDHLGELSSPALTSQADIDAMLVTWRSVARTAPLQIEPEWDAVVANIETANTVDPADPTSVQRAADRARATEQAANRIIAYTFNVCGATIGKVAPVKTTTTTTKTTTSPTTTG